MATNHRKVFNNGFTLAEVLITLGIIGVVAALTIPTLMNNVQTEQYRSQLKKNYSNLTNAINALYAQNRSIDTSSEANFMAELATQFKVAQSGTYGSITTLPANFNYKCYGETSGTCGGLMQRPAYDAYTSFVTTDGMIVVIYRVRANCDGSNWHSKIDASETFPQNNYCAVFHVDLNGDRNPNQIGKDMHLFYLLKKNDNYYVRAFGSNNAYDCTAGYPSNYNMSMHCTNRMLLDMPMP